MKRRKTIQQFFACCLVVIFAISNTPEIYFHDVIANHQDVVSSCDHVGKFKACLHEKEHNCQADNLVVTTPYLILSVVNSSLIHSLYQEINTVYFSSLSQDCQIHTESRGPPSV